MSQAWPPELDGLRAAPEHRLLLENERVRVLDTEIVPGEQTPLHTHRWAAVHYVLSFGDFVLRDEPLDPHTLETVGETPTRIVSFEVKA